MNTNNLGLSTLATGQMERMIDDAAWLTYPFHLAVGIIKTFVYTVLAILCFIFAVCIWMFTAKDKRAEQIKDFAKDQSIYRVDTATNAVTVHKAGEQRMGETRLAPRSRVRRTMASSSSIRRGSTTTGSAKRPTCSVGPTSVLRTTLRL